MITCLLCQVIMILLFLKIKWRLCYCLIFLKIFSEVLFKIMRLPWKFWNLFSIRRKSKTWFFNFLNVYVFWIEWVQNPNLADFNSKIQIFCRPEWAKGGTLWKWILTIFKWKNEFPKGLVLEQQMKKMESFVWFSCLLSKL